MRIDEFSNSTDIDSVVSDKERVRFACFGFDINSDEAEEKSFNYLSFLQRVRLGLTNWIEIPLVHIRRV